MAPVIDAKREGSCAACGHAIVVGERIEYTTAEGPRHLACLDVEFPTTRRNLYKMKCSACRTTLKRGEGVLSVFESMVEGEFSKRYEATCVDQQACSDRVAGRVILAARSRRHW